MLSAAGIATAAVAIPHQPLGSLRPLPPTRVVGCLGGRSPGFRSQALCAVCASGASLVVLRRPRKVSRCCVVSAEQADARSAPVKIGVILLNIGTPASTDLDDVTDYLSRFLGDERVMDIKNKEEKRAILEKILRSRPSKSAEGYKAIWDPVRGSPLLYHSKDLAANLQRELGGAYEIRLGFQYSEPSVETALSDLMSLKVSKVILVPMFPHFAQATVGAFLANTCQVAAKLKCATYLQVLPPFYKNTGFITAALDQIRGVIGPEGCQVDHTIFSFHGIPESQCTRTDETESICMKVSGCCSMRSDATRNCYRAQCLETARLLTAALELPEERWSLAFQSRRSLRRAIDWTKPFTDELLSDLARAGKKRVAVVSPSYTADCIETLGSLGKEGRVLFAEGGGE
ncbi:unnamed protein product, partial [Polarella glacialis]